MFTLKSDLRNIRITGDLLSYEFGGASNTLYIRFGKSTNSNDFVEVTAAGVDPMIRHSLTVLGRTALNLGYTMDLDNMSVSSPSEEDLKAVGQPAVTKEQQSAIEEINKKIEEMKKSSVA